MKRRRNAAYPGLTPAFNGGGGPAAGVDARRWVDPLHKKADMAPGCITRSRGYHSRHSAGGVSYGKISTQADRANRAFTNSCSDPAPERRASDPRAPDARRGRHPDRGGQGQSTRASGRDTGKGCGRPRFAACWDQVEFDAAVLHARRVKNGPPSRRTVPRALLSEVILRPRRFRCRHRPRPRMSSSRQPRAKAPRRTG